jgi:hypothetical protein
MKGNRIRNLIPHNTILVEGKLEDLEGENLERVKLALVQKVQD